MTPTHHGQADQPRDRGEDQRPRSETSWPAKAFARRLLLRVEVCEREASEQSVEDNGHPHRQGEQMRVPATYAPSGARAKRTGSTVVSRAVERGACMRNPVASGDKRATWAYANGCCVVTCVMACETASWACAHWLITIGITCAACGTALIVRPMFSAPLARSCSSERTSFSSGGGGVAEGPGSDEAAVLPAA